MNRDLAWFEPSHPVVDDDTAPMRPVSLASMLALELLGVTLLQDPPPALDLTEEMRQLRVFHWLHTAPIEEVKTAIWTGAARVAFRAEEPSDAVIAWFRAHLQRLRALLAECQIELMQRPSERRFAEKPPPELYRPTLMSAQLLRIAEKTGMAPDAIAWMPAAQALQLYHAARWLEGSWTIRPKPRAPISQESFENFNPVAGL